MSKEISTPPKTAKRRPVTVGEISGAIGMDVRELWIDGYTMKQINEVFDSKSTLRELRKSKPLGTPIDTQKQRSQLEGSHEPK